MRPIFRVMFRALRYRNFRLFFMGQSISLIGTWMQFIAMSWLVYRLTGSAFMLGVVGFSSQIPSFLLSPVAGVLVDRWDRHKILIYTQAFAMLQALTLAVLTLTGTVAVWHIIVLGVFLGCVNSFDAPARQSFIIDMVEKKEMLGNAIALNSLMFNGARLIGPSIAGMLIAVTGEGICFLTNGLSFLAVLVSLFLMNIKKQSMEHKTSNILHGLKEGTSYTFGFAPIRHILMLLGTISLMGMSYTVLMPVFAKDILHGGPSTLGFLMASAGVGAIIATVFLASQKNTLRFGNIIPISSAIFSLGIIAFSLSRVLWLSLFFMALTGFGFMTHMAACNTFLQTIVDDDKRGRVMSYYAMSFLGMAPIGSILAGSLATWMGPTNALITGGIVCLAASLVFAAKVPELKKMVHPIYVKMGVIPEVVAGINAASRLAVPPED
ncbi:MAG: MFS transporter [Candidatus Omnitrophota bacterium]|jgi:MFS family permease